MFGDHRWPKYIGLCFILVGILLVSQGATVNATVDERDSDMGGGAVFHDNRVEVEKVSG
jgi:hypothetical protein